MASNMGNNEAEQLLLDALPFFVEAPARLPPRIRTLQCELQVLVSALKAGLPKTNKSSSTYREILDALLTLFEGFVKDEVQSQSEIMGNANLQDYAFPKLQALRAYSPPGEGNHRRKRLIHTGKWKKDHRDTLKVLTAHNTNLLGEEHHRRQLKSLSSFRERAKLDNRINIDQGSDSELASLSGLPMVSSCKSIGSQFRSPSLDIVIRYLERHKLSGSKLKTYPILTLKGRRVLSVMLARCVLQFYDGAWVSKPWSKKNIILCQDPGGDRIVLSASPSPSYDAAECAHHFPGLLSLGIALLELELMKSIESVWEEEVERLRVIRQNALHEKEGQSSPEERNANTDLYTALLMFKSVPEQAMRTFTNAIFACLSFKLEEVKGLKDSALGPIDPTNTGLQRNIYERIVRPLETELTGMFPSVDLGALNSLPVLFLNSGENQVLDGLVPDIKNTSIQSYMPNQVSIAEPVLFDEHELPASEINEGAKFDQWFETYNASVDKLMENIKRLHQEKIRKALLEKRKIAHLDKSKIPRPGKAKNVDVAKLPHNDDEISTEEIESAWTTSDQAAHVKVAILDTGLDWKNPYIRGVQRPRERELKRIKKTCDFVGDRAELEREQQVIDDDGHGTRIAVLLLSTAPTADLYVARVIGKNGDPIDPTKLAKAMKCAVDEWGVDIISISFGYKTRVPELQEAIQEAFYKGVTILAATSNQGGNGGVAYPAREFDMVLGINSTDGDGNWAAFSPEPLKDSGENFCTMGVAVQPSGATKRWSGTSYSTPIAAGIAAMMLYSARMILEDLQLLKEVRNCSRMRALLKKLLSGTREVSPEREKKSGNSQPLSNLEEKLNFLISAIPDLAGHMAVERGRGTVLRPSEYWTKPLKFVKSDIEQVLMGLTVA